MLAKRTVYSVLCGILALPGIPAIADQIQLTGTVRDFKRGDWNGGHGDFETANTVSGHGSYGHVINLTSMSLSDGGKPIYNPTRPSNNTMVSETVFNQWFKDDPAINATMPLTLTLSNGTTCNPGGTYTYTNSSFFPIDNKMFGNQGLSHNFHFTFELHTQFTYVPGQVFKFTGDDDVWVYINGTKVIDLGGVHGAVSGQIVLLDGKVFITNQGGSLTNNTINQKKFPVGGVVQNVTSAIASNMAQQWTAAGKTGTCPIAVDQRFIDLQLGTNQNCKLEFFFAERHTTQSNFRIDTSIILQTVQPTTISPLYD